MEQHKFEAGAYFMTVALRQLGYTNYTAIADIIDNSLETEVGSKNIFIDLIKEKKEKNGQTGISEILISDDGSGMDKNTLLQAFRLGSRTGKEFEYNFGAYGAGLKVAAISIGKRLTVFTKTEEGGLLKAILDIDNIDEESDTVSFSLNEYTEDSEEYSFFKEHTKSNHGTIVSISKLDRLQCDDYYGFAGTLTKKIRILFNKFIDANTCSFFVNEKKLKFFDVTGSKNGIATLMDEGTFEYDGSIIGWKAWYIPLSVQKTDGDDWFGRTTSSSGLYIYRHMRLVGQGVDLGLIHKQGHWTTGLKFELFMDGTADKLFGTTFTKMVTEKDRSSIEQGFYDKLQKLIGPYREQVKSSQNRESNEEKVSEDMKNALARTTEILNHQKPLLANTVRQKGKNEKPGDTKPKNPNPTPQKHPNPTKNRKGEWCGGFRFISDGGTGFMYDILREEGKAVVLINQDHAFYENIFKHLDDEGRNNMALYLACEYSALENSDYYINDDANKYISTYKSCYGDAVRRVFI